MGAKPRRPKYSDLTEPYLEEIERLARENKSETYSGALLALVAEVRRLRGALLKADTLPKYGDRK